MSNITLRPYQRECIRSIPEEGRYLIQMATGLGKTVTFSRIPRRGRMLILSHREELVRQPLKYFDCLTGVEMAGATTFGTEEVISASVQSIARRLDRFSPDAFDIVIVDEAHHAAANTYRTILSHFHPRLVLGFTATPNRGDKVRLDDIFTDIIFSRDLRWGIANHYLSDIHCQRIDIGYDLSAVHTRMGDYAPGELERAMDGTSDAIAEAYRTLAKGSTLIFATSISHAEEVAQRIPGAVVVTGKTQNRQAIVRDFTEGNIPCIVNCQVFTEGTDIPRVESVMIARPTQSEALYTQMVGRGLRTFPGKDKLNLIDCVGITGSASLCTAPSLLGIDVSQLPERKKREIQGDLFDLPDMVVRASDIPESWIQNVKIVNLWAKEQSYQTHDVAWFKMPDGSFTLSLPGHDRLTISAQDELGRCLYAGRVMPMQEALDQAYRFLQAEKSDSRAIWDRSIMDRWGKAPATEKQIAIVRRMCRDFNADGLTKAQASMILNRVFGGRSA